MTQGKIWVVEEPVSGPSDEQIPEEGGDDETGVIPPADEQPAAPADPADPAPEAPADPAPEVPADPADPEAPADPETPADPEAPVDEPAVEEPVEEEVEDPALEDVEINAGDEEVTEHTVTIKDYRKVLNSVSISASAGSDLEISNDGKITVEEGKTLSLTIGAKSNWRLVSVKTGDEAWSGSGPYTRTIDADTEVVIEVVATYAFTLTNDDAPGVTLQRLTTNAEGEAVKVDFAGSPVDKDGEDLKLVTKGYTASNDTLTFSYGADGETPEPLAGVEQDDPTVADAKVTVYTIPANEIAALDALSIVLVKNEQVAVSFEANDKVEVKVWGEKTPANGDTPAEMDWVNVPSPYKVIKGEKAKFKATAKDFYKITEVKANVNSGGAEKVCDASADGTYELEITGATEFSFTTEIDSAKSKPLSFNLAADKGSATVKVTGVTLKPVAPATSDNVLSGQDLTDFLTAHIAADGSLDPEAAEAYKIPDTVKDITVEVKAAASGDYKLSKINGTAVKTDPDETGTATRKIAYGDIGEIKVETTAVASEDATYFKFNPNKKTAENAGGVDHIEVKMGATAGGTIEAVTGKTNVFKVKSGTGIASFTIEAGEGWALPAALVTTLKRKPSVVDVTSEVKDKKMIYTVKLLAKKLGSDDTTNLVDLGSVTGEEIRAFSAAVDTETSSAAGYTVTTPFDITEDENFPATGMADTTIADDNIPYNAKLETTISAAPGYTLKSVTGTMGGTALPKIDILNNAAPIEIAKVTGDVKFTVETAEAYTVTLAAATGDDHTPTQPDEDLGDMTWAVKYDKKYAVTVIPAVALSDLSAEIKDGETVVGRGKKISGELQLWMTKAWAGKELTVDVKAKGVKIGELTLQVNKQRGTLSIKSEGTAKQDVASTKVYEIETDGEKLPSGSSAVAVTGALSSKVTASINAAGNLAVTVAPAKFADVNTDTTTGTGEEAVRTVTPKQAVITITDPDDGTLKAKMTLEANAIFDTESKPSVSLVDGGASDTILNVDVSMDGVIAPTDGTSKVYYVVTAKAKADVPASGDTPASNRSEKLLATKTETVSRKGGSQRVELKLGVDSNKLGEGAEWDYEVTAKAVYALDGAVPTGVTSETAAAGANSDVSAISDKLETKTVTPLFEAGLKLKKDSKKKPASTLYTGQSNLYIATPQWSKKNVNYKITDKNVGVVDLTGFGITATINDAGDLVVTNVATNATLGKHTLQVTATADETTGHTMYASRATINVTVVKGINSLGVITPADQIFKQANKAATFKATADYGYVYDSKGKKVYPKTKKVTWSIVGGTSEVNGSNNIDNFTLTAAPAGITIKNGTVTVAKNFTIDTKHPQNNSFRVLVQAADFAGNKVATLSRKITVTSGAADISNLVIATDAVGGKNVIAVKTGTKSAKAQDVKAEDIEGAKVYAMSGTVAPGFVPTAKWDTLGVVDYHNLKFAPVKGNLIVDYDGEIMTAVAGKKATITVSTTDGGKKKNSFALNMGYTEADPTAALKITATDADEKRATPIAVTPKPTKETDAEAKVEKEFELPGVAKLDVEVYTAVRNDKGAFRTFEEINDFANYKLTVKGGKFASDGKIYTTAKVTTLNLTVGAGKAAKKYTYILTNKAYNETAKAKVTVKNSLHTYGNDEEQKVKMVALNGKDSFGDNKYAKVELDKTTMPKYNPNNTTPYYAWWRINNNIKSNYIKLNKDTGEFDLEFNGDTSYTAGSYKLKVTIGEGATAAAFKAKTQPVNVTLKVVKNKTFSFKPTTSYTINKVDGGAVLTGKTNLSAKAGELCYMDFTKLQNANVNGKSNLFTHYFKIADDDVTGTQRITLNTTDPLVEKLLYETKDDGTLDKSKPIADPDLSSIAKDKANLTGYLTYTVGSSVDYYYGDPVTNTVKITVKIAPEAKKGKYKATQKYVQESGTEIGLKKGNTTKVNILVNGAYVSVAHAIIDESKAKSNAAELAGEVSVDGGQIVLKAAADLDAAKKGGYSINLLIVPTTSFYANAITNTTKAEDKKALIQRYGTPVKVTVVAKEKPKATPSIAAPVVPDEPDVPPVTEKTEAEVKAMVEAWIGTLTGTNVWLKNGTTKATLTEKANANEAIHASGWTVEITAPATLSGATATTAGTATTITYSLTKSSDSTTVTGIDSTAKITLPAGAIGMDDVKAAVLAVSVTVSANENATTIQGNVGTALEAITDKANIDNYYTIAAGEVTGLTGNSNTEAATNDNVSMAVTITPKDGGAAQTVTLSATVS